MDLQRGQHVALRTLYIQVKQVDARQVVKAHQALDAKPLNHFWFSGELQSDFIRLVQPGRSPVKCGVMTESVACKVTVGKFKISWIWFAQDDARCRYLLREPETVVAPEATQLNHGRAWLKPFQDSAEDEFLLGLMVATQLLNDATHPVAVVAPVLNLHAVEHPLP